MFKNNEYLAETEYLKIQALIGKRLKIQRNMSEVTLFELSLKTGIGENHLSKIENGKIKAPSLKIYLRICYALKIDPINIFKEIYKVIPFSTQK